MNNDDPLTVLVADADPDFRSVLWTLFEQEGHCVAETTNGTNGQEAVEAGRYHLA